MPAYFRVSPKIWNNRHWSEDTRTLAFYVLTCPHRNTEGLYRLPKEYIVADLEWSAERADAALKALVVDDVIEWEHDVVLVLNALKYQSPGNPNQVKAAVRAIEMVPVTRLDQSFARLVKWFSERLTEGLAEALPERFAHALALAPTPSLTPPPPQGDGGENGARAEGQERNHDLHVHLVAEGFAPDDVVAALKRLTARQKFGEPIKDPAAWMTRILERMAQAREVAGETPMRIEVDGEWMRMTPDGWELEEVSA